MSLALVAGTVLTALDPPHLVRADVVTSDGRIAAVGQAPAGVPTRDCSGCLIIPGNVCGHTHIYSALARGMPYRLPPPTNFLQILQRVWWRLDRALDEETIRHSALVAGMDALLSGTTTLIDHHASPNAIDGSLDILADALESLGVRSVLCYEVTDRDGPRRARAGVAENRRFLRARRRLTRGLVGAHASFTMSVDTLAACVEVARDRRVGIHIHVAEDLVDERDALARFGRRVVHRLADAGALDDRAMLAHCVHVDEEEVDLIRQSRATVAHNARSNMNNAVGRAPLARLGENIVLGTDGIDGNMFAESQAAYWRAREDDVLLSIAWPLQRLSQTAHVSARIFGKPSRRLSQTDRDTARILGMPLGEIRPGAPADLTILAHDPPTPLHDLSAADHWIFGLSSRFVRDVMVAGELVVADRRLTRVDQDKVVADARQAAERLWQRLDEIGSHKFRPAGVD